jgi:predicted nucleic acid-binding protein
VVDASFVATLVLKEKYTNVAQALWQGWSLADVNIYAPMLMPFEAASTIRKHVQRQLISQEAGEIAFAALLELAHFIELVEPIAYLHEAWKLAREYQLTVVYDACYVALAEQEDAILWTGDGRMLRAMPQHAGRIRTLNPGP